jgi:acyl carrier protein
MTTSKEKQMPFTNNEIEKKIREILIEQEVITDRASIHAGIEIREGLLMDEFQIIELIGEIESIYSITLDTDEVDALKTIGQLVELIQRDIEKG